jgi:3-hydroxymyristoyl/3-hydroxydecanoyl-(acyl carrier protein) dehydratase
VFPGDEIAIEIGIIQRRDPIWRFEAVATVEGERVADATLLAGLISADANERGLSAHRTGIGRKG